MQRNDAAKKAFDEMAQNFGPAYSSEQLFEVVQILLRGGFKEEKARVEFDQFLFPLLRAQPIRLLLLAQSISNHLVQQLP